VSSEHAEIARGNTYFDEDGNYNFHRDFQYREVYKGLQEKHPEKSADEIHKLAAAELANDYKAVIKEHSDNGLHTGVNAKRIKYHMDEYAGYILTKNSDMRHSKNPDTGLPNFKNDKEFLEWHAGVMERYESQSYNSIQPNINWSKQMKEYYDLGKLTVSNNDGSPMFDGKANAVVDGKLQEFTNIADLVEAIANEKSKGGRLGGGSGEKYKHTVEAMMTAIQPGGSLPSGVEIIGIMPGGKNAGDLECMVTVNSKTVPGYTGQPFNFTFNLPNSKLANTFKVSHAMHTAATSGSIENYTANNPATSQIVNVNGQNVVMRGYYQFNAKSRDYEPVFDIVDTNGNVLQTKSGPTAMQDLMNREFNVLTSEGGELGAILGESTKGTIVNP